MVMVSEGKVINFETLLLLIRSMGELPKDANREFRSTNRYSGPTWFPTVGKSPIMCSRGG